MAASCAALLVLTSLCWLLIAQPGHCDIAPDNQSSMFGQGGSGAKKVSDDTCSEHAHPAPERCPHIDHVIIAMMENRASTLLTTKRDQVKNIQKMIDTYSPATKYYGYTHDSEPNYIAITSGTNACTHSDNDLVYTQESIFDQLSQRGKTWKCYSQSIPLTPPGFNGSATPGDLYKRKHNPCAMYASTVTIPQGNVGYEEFKADLAADTLPKLSFVVPDQCHDMHGASGCHFADDAALVAAGDLWTAEFWEKVTGSNAWKHKRVLVAYVYDEDDYKTATGCCGSPITRMNSPGDAICSWNANCDGGTAVPPGQCPEQFYQGYTVIQPSASVPIYGGGHTLAAFAYSKATSRCILDYPMNHLSVLKTIQHCWRLPLLANTKFPNVPYLDECIFK